MQDVYLPIATALARPLQTPKGTALYQLWRADFAALARLARTCREASMAVRRLLWHCTKLGERERARHAQRKRVRAFMRLPTVATLLVSMSWTREFLYAKHYIHTHSRTTVAFNGRIRMREDRFCGRRLRLARPSIPPSMVAICVGLTLSDQSRRLLIWHHGAISPFITGTFTNYEGALGALRYSTFIGRERWDEHPELRERFLRYNAHSLKHNLDFEAIVPTA
jgi:hypothetical protein